MNECRSPKTVEEFDQYYQLRWQVLRKPWNQPTGSERDALEQECIHRMIIDANNRVLAVGRLEKINHFTGKIRYVAVSPDAAGQGLGLRVINALEVQAQQLGIKKLELNARESAIGFYQKLGYCFHEFSHLLFNEVKHFSMSKEIGHHKNHQYQATSRLESVWHKTIPLSKAMHIQMSHYDGEQLIAHCDDDFNKNLHNTMFAGSIYTLATLTGWGWVYLQLQKLALAGDIVLAKADIKYHSPIKGLAYSKLVAENVTGNLTVLSTGRNARVDLITHLYCGDNIAATFKGSYAVLPVKNKTKK